MAEYGPVLARNLDGCFVDAECVASAGTAYRSIVDGFDGLPAPPAEIEPLVARVSDGFDPIQAAAIDLRDCLDVHKGEVIAAKCYEEITTIRELLADQSAHLGAWDPYI